MKKFSDENPSLVFRVPHYWSKACGMVPNMDPIDRYKAVLIKACQLAEEVDDLQVVHHFQQDSYYPKNTTNPKG